MRFIGVDLGASFIKSAVLEPHGDGLRDVRRIPFPAFIAGSPRFREADAENIARLVRNEIDARLKALPECGGIVMSGQMHGLVLMGTDGAALSNFISWQDQRTNERHRSGGTHFEALRSLVGDEDFRKLGRELRPGYPLSTLFWLKETGSLPAGATPASLPDFVVSRLCGSEVRSEPTHASASGAYDLAAGDWHRPLIARLGLDCLRWPKLSGAGEIVGRVARPGGREVPVYAPIGDQQSSLLGSLLERDELSINVATGSQVAAITGAPGACQTRPYFDGLYLSTVTHIPAGRALNALLRALVELSPAAPPEIDALWGKIAASAASIPETDLKIDLSFFPAAFSERGMISNIREENLSAAHLFRAAFDRMADDYKRAAEAIAPGSDWSRIVFSGGLAMKLEPLRALILRRFACPHRLSPASEDALNGLLALALKCGGGAATFGEAADILRRRSGSQAAPDRRA